ncbi:MAG TPA: ABC transporter substrate-binding protein, partial [Trueperaceae bacterium]|nr:ABC transporter substrate-binding protein [Trueperaceae bacterium]
MKRVLIALFVACLAFVTAVASAQDTVKIGVITSLTGRFAEFGEQHKAGIQAALEDVNAAGGVNGALVEVVFEDDISEVNAALTAGEKLVNQGL